MAYLHDGARAAWLAHPRTGSRAVARALCLQAGFRSASADGSAGGPPCRAWHHDGLPEDLPWEPRSVAATVRHPGPTVVSWWEHRRRRPDWRTLLREGLTVDHRAYWPDPHRLWALHGDRADALLRHERLERHLNDWLDRLSLPAVRLERVTEERDRLSRDWRSYYDPEDLRALWRRYGAEASVLGYVLPDAGDSP